MRLYQKHTFTANIAILSLGLITPAATQTVQLNDNCVVAVLNRTVQAHADGSWVLPNVPANLGSVRARATCVQNGITTFGQSDLFVLSGNDTMNLPPIQLGNVSPIPLSAVITAPASTLTLAGATVQLAVKASYSSGAVQDITQATTGTQYKTSNAAIASVTANGLVSAVSSGTAVIQATNEGAGGLISIRVVLAGASHGGIPDTYAIANGFDPNDPSMPFADPDRDGLTNLQEFQSGTDPRNADSDGDGLTDGQEVLLYRTNPATADTDGDGIPDGVEAATRSDPLNAASFNLGQALASLEVKPTDFVLTVNAISGIASQQLTVLGHLIDGKTVLDLTSTLKGTNYSSSDLTICNFGSPDGSVFAGNNGQCTITVRNGGFFAQSHGTINAFSPTSLSFVAIPGFANGVSVNGNYAYVAAGGSGLQVVDVTDRSQPRVVASLPLPGNANGIKVLGNLAYIAGGSAGLQVVDVTNPLAPVLRGTLATTGNTRGVAVRGSTAYLANFSNLILADVTDPTAITQMSALALNGTIQGVDVDSQRNIAVVTAGTSGIYVIDISNPFAPILRGTAATGDARAVAIGGNYAFVADFLNSTTSIDISTPSAPIVRSHITDSNLGGFLQDIALSGNFAFGADIKFVNGVPITDVSNPNSLVVRAILNFPQRDDNGMGLAVDGSYVYLAADPGAINKYGTTGASRLYIGQYLARQDLKGAPPTVRITSPTAASTALQGARLPITVSATDDVAVGSVGFQVNGQPLFTATSLPYQFNYTIPAGVSSLNLSATAVDLGGNVGTSQNIVIGVLPDPLTTVTGAVTNANGQPVASATVKVFGTFSGVTAANGTFSIPGVPTVRGSIVASAVATIIGVQQMGSSAAFSPVGGGITNLGTITVKGAWSGTAIVTSTNSSPASSAVHVLDINARTIKSTVHPSAHPFDVAVTPDSATAVVSDFTSQAVELLDLGTNPPATLGLVGVGFATVDVEVAPGGFALVAGSTSSTIASINIATRQIVSTLDVGVFAQGITVTPSGKVLVNSASNSVIRVVDLSPAGILSDTGISLPATTPRNVTVSPDGQLALVANSSTIGVLRIASEGSVTSGASLPNFSGAQSIAFTPDGRHAYVAQSTSQVGVLDIDAAGIVSDSGVRISGIGSLLGYTGPDQIVAAPNGTVLVHGVGKVSIIDVATNTIVGTITIPTDSGAGGIAIGR